MAQQGPVSIRFMDESQNSQEVQRLAREVTDLLMPGEEILYVAFQNRTALSARRDGIVATSHRLISYKPNIRGGASFNDTAWRDVKDVHMDWGTFSSTFVITLVSGQVGRMNNLNRDQARRLYSIAQEREEHWHERRRERAMEESRAAAGGIVINGLPLAGGAPPAPQPAPAADDAVTKLQKAKTLLDSGLISQEEFDQVKARILASM